MPTVDEMRTAYAQIAKRDWPPLEALAAAARQFELVLGQARRTARPLRAIPPELLVQLSPATPAPAPAAAHHPRAPSHAPPFDHKRAASGERPDDE